MLENPKIVYKWTKYSGNGIQKQPKRCYNKFSMPIQAEYEEVKRKKEIKIWGIRQSNFQKEPNSL